MTSLLTDTDEVLECAVCYSQFYHEGSGADDLTPRALPCGHTFCTGCLRSLQSRRSINCPTCREKTTNVPVELPINRSLLVLRDLLVEPLKDGQGQGQGQEQEQGRDGQGQEQEEQGRGPWQETRKTCQDHPSRPIRYYCELHRMTFCYECKRLHHQEVWGCTVVSLRPARHDTLLKEDPMTCPKCRESYSPDRVPRLIFCGHSLCTHCITTLADPPRLSCHRCYKTELVSLNTSPINYSLHGITANCATLPAATCATHLGRPYIAYCPKHCLWLCFECQLSGQHKGEWGCDILGLEESVDYLHTKGEEYIAACVRGRSRAVEELRELGPSVDVTIAYYRQEMRRCSEAVERLEGEKNYAARLMAEGKEFDQLEQVWQGLHGSRDVAGTRTATEELQCLSQHMQQWFDCTNRFLAQCVRSQENQERSVGKRGTSESLPPTKRMCQMPPPPSAIQTAHLLNTTVAQTTFPQTTPALPSFPKLDDWVPQNKGWQMTQTRLSRAKRIGQGSNEVQYDIIPGLLSIPAHRTNMNSQRTDETIVANVNEENMTSANDGRNVRDDMISSKDRNASSMNNIATALLMRVAKQYGNKEDMLYPELMAFLTEGGSDRGARVIAVPKKSWFRMTQMSGGGREMVAGERVGMTEAMVAEEGVMAAVVEEAEGQLLLHTLQDVPRKEVIGCSILPYEEVHVLSRVYGARVFLDLSWPSAAGEATTRVYIRLHGATGKGRHFLDLCTGTHGRTYAGTSFLHVHNQEQPGECILAGDTKTLKSHSAMSATTVGSERENLHEVEVAGDYTWGGLYSHAWSPGVVWGGYGTQWDKFGITLKPWWTEVVPSCFGWVESDLGILRDLAMLDDVTTVRIVDSGVVVY